MKHSEHINELVAALAEAQGEFLPIEKNRTGKVKSERAEFSYDYADLSDVMSAVRPALSKHGLALSHDATVTREPVLCVNVVARLEHSSGQWKESSALEIPCDGKMGAAQLIGSADTYGRRYTTCSILGVVAESDDDGAAASGGDVQTSNRAPLPICPKCQTNKSVIAGKAEYGGGYLCFAKKGGCGQKWQADGEIPDPKSITDPELMAAIAAEDQIIADILGQIVTHTGFESPLKALYEQTITPAYKQGSARLKQAIVDKVKPAYEAALPESARQPATSAA